MQKRRAMEHGYTLLPLKLLVSCSLSSRFLRPNTHRYMRLQVSENKSAVGLPFIPGRRYFIVEYHAKALVIIASEFMRTGA